MRLLLGRSQCFIQHLDQSIAVIAEGVVLIELNELLDCLPNRPLGLFLIRYHHVAHFWRWIEEGEGNAVVTDVMMPDGNGLEMLPAIKRKRPELPVIVISGQ